MEITIQSIRKCRVYYPKLVMCILQTIHLRHRDECRRGGRNILGINKRTVKQMWPGCHIRELIDLGNIYSRPSQDQPRQKSQPIWERNSRTCTPDWRAMGNRWLLELGWGQKRVNLLQRCELSGTVYTLISKLKVWQTRTLLPQTLPP